MGNNFRYILITIISLVLMLTGLFFLIYRFNNKDKVVVDNRAEYPESIYYRESRTVQLLLEQASCMAITDRNILVGGDKKLLLLSTGAVLENVVELEFAPLSICHNRDFGVILAFANHVGLYSYEGDFIGELFKLDGNAKITSMISFSGYLFLVDAVGKKIIRYNIHDKKHMEINRYNGQKFILPSPYFELAAGKDNTFFVTDPGRRKIVNLDINMNYLSSWGKSSFALDGFAGCCNPVQLAVTNKMDFITVEKGNNRIKLYSEQGEFLDLILIDENLPKGTEIRDIAIDENNSLYILETKALRIFSLLAVSRT